MMYLPVDVFKRLLATRTYKYSTINQMNHPSFYMRSLIKSTNEQIKIQEKPSKKRGRKPKKKVKPKRSEGGSEREDSGQIKGSDVYKQNYNYFKSVVLESRVNKTDHLVQSDPESKKAQGKSL